jgi:hypothetical protein
MEERVAGIPVGWKVEQRNRDAGFEQAPKYPQ